MRSEGMRGPDQLDGRAHKINNQSPVLALCLIPVSVLLVGACLVHKYNPCMPCFPFYLGEKEE